jgi:hypothetical protein
LFGCQTTKLPKDSERLELAKREAITYINPDGMSFKIMPILRDPSWAATCNVYTGEIHVAANTFNYYNHDGLVYILIHEMIHCFTRTTTHIDDRLNIMNGNMNRFYPIWKNMTRDERKQHVHEYMLILGE